MLGEDLREKNFVALPQFLGMSFTSANWSQVGFRHLNNLKTFEIDLYIALSMFAPHDAAWLEITEQTPSQPVLQKAYLG